MYLALLLLHLLISMLVLLGMWLKVIKVPKYTFFVVLLIPVWGVLLVMLLHFHIAFFADGVREIGVEKLLLESELYKSITVDDKTVSTSTVPIEEALLINSARDRRNIIMDVLNDNPKEYVSFLQKAGNNDDTEVVHYAVTAMVEISKENDEWLQMYAARYEQDPEDIVLLTEYADFLWECLSRDLMQGQVEVLNRELFSKLIEKKIEKSPTLEDYVRMIQNAMKQKKYAWAAQALDQMARQYPNCEAYYLLKLEYLAEMQQGAEIQRLIDEIENSHIYMSADAKEVLAFWRS